jgi:hypothetical protein
VAPELSDRLPTLDQMSLVVAYRAVLRCPDCGAVEERDEMSAPTAATLAGVAAALGTVGEDCACTDGAALVVEAVEVGIGDVELTLGADGRLYEADGSAAAEDRLATLLRATLPVAA